MEIRILFEDEQIIVCEKPAGVAVQTKRLGQADMESLLKNRRAGKGEPPYIGVVHRLDQPVSGVMVFAKTKESAAALGRQIASAVYREQSGRSFPTRFWSRKTGAPFFGFIWEPADIIRSARSWHMQGCRLWETGSTILKRI